jgi:ParB/RepB/Spo0J family partition protein
MAARKSNAARTTQTETAGTERVKSRKGKLVEALLSECDAESFENQRTGDFTKGDSRPSGEGNSFKELTESIDEGGGWDSDGVHTGLREPITGRYIAGKRGKQVLQIVAGFRRFAAINLLAQRDGITDARIPVLVKELTDTEALEENIFENSARDDLSGPDLAWAAYNLRAKYLADGGSISDNQIAKRMGKNQTHISRLLRILSAAPTVCQAWRESPAPLKLDDIERISKLDPKEQETEYEKVIKAKSGQTGPVGPGGKPLLEIATKKAQRIASTVGELVKNGLVNSNIDWTADLEKCGVNLEGLSTSERKTVGAAAHTAFATAVTPPVRKPAAATAAASTEN